MLVSQHNIKVVPKIFGYNLFILEKSILYITVKNTIIPIPDRKIQRRYSTIIIKAIKENKKINDIFESNLRKTENKYINNILKL